MANRDKKSTSQVARWAWNSFRTTVAKWVDILGVFLPQRRISSRKVVYKKILMQEAWYCNIFWGSLILLSANSLCSWFQDLWYNQRSQSCKSPFYRWSQIYFINKIVELLLNKSCHRASQYSVRICRLPVFELWTSDVGSDCPTSWATSSSSYSV